MRKAHTVRRVRKHEEHANHEAWAIPFGDLMTLLLAFFVVMYAISSVNAGKYRVLSDSLFAAFRGAPRTMQPIQVGEKQVGSGADIATSIVQQSMLEGQPRSLLATRAATGTQSPATGNPPVAAPSVARPNGAAAASAALQRVADEVVTAMDDLVQQNLLIVKRSDFWIEVEIRTDILFQTGSAQLGRGATGVIERLADVLGPFPNPIRVEGHTDNKPIRTVSFYSNWELSAARAASVVRVLSSHGVDPNRLAVIGYGEQRPLQPNDTPEGRNANRRVVMVILSTQLGRGSEATQSANNATDAALNSSLSVAPGQPDPAPQALPVAGPPASPSVPGAPAQPGAVALPPHAGAAPAPTATTDAAAPRSDATAAARSGAPAATLRAGVANTQPAGMVPAP